MFLIAFGVILYVVLQNLRELSQALGWLVHILTPILTGLCIAFVLNVFLRRLEKLLLRIRPLRGKKRLTRALSITLCMVLAIGLIVLTAVVLIPKLVQAGQLVVSLLPQAGEHINDFVTDFMTGQGMDPEVIESATNYITKLTNQLLDLIRNSSTSIASFLMSSVMSAASSAYTLITGFLLAVYVLYHKETVQRYCIRTLQHVLPDLATQRITRVASVSFSTYTHFVEGQLLQSVILGVVCYLGLLLFHIPYAEIISLITALFGLIPILGGWISGIVSALLIVATNPDQLLVFLIYFLTLQQLIGSLVYPRIVGSQMGLPSLLVLCAILIGQALFGMLGILFCVPLAAVLFTFYREELKRPPRFRKHSPEENARQPGRAK